MGRVQTLSDYYADPLVRERIAEYCGTAPSGGPTCVYLAAMRGSEGPCATWDRALRFEVAALDSLLAGGADVARSMWDRANLLVHLDIDYLNIDVQDEAFHHSGEVFFKLEPVFQATGHVFRRFGLPVLTLTTGRGYHFTCRVPLASEVVDRLAALVPETPRWVDTVARRRPAFVDDAIPPRQARAYVGVGMMIEFLAHRILRRARRRSPIPVVLNGTVVGSGLAGRDCVSLDLSYAGDPLDVRHLRVAFGSYQKHRVRPDRVAHGGASGRPPFAAVPRGRQSLPHLLTDRCELRHAVRTARARSAALPVATDGVARVLDAYDVSALARFHRAFYASPAGDTAAFDARPGSARWTALPPCVVRPLVAPNDLLLQPAVIQHVTRALVAEGLSPRTIAAVIESRYTEDFNWGDRWFWLEPRARAEFDVRVFAGLLATGVDEAIDFNCRSSQEKGLCPGTACARDLRTDRARLFEAVRG